MKIQILSQEPLECDLIEKDGEFYIEVYISPRYVAKANGLFNKDHVVIQRIMLKKDKLPTSVKIIND